MSRDEAGASSVDYLLGRRRWLDHPEALIISGTSILVSAFLILVAPRIGMLLVELGVGLLLLLRGFVLRLRLRRASQLCLELWGPKHGNGRIPVLGRYELFLIITVILAYASASRILRARGVADALLQIISLVLVGTGLLAKSPILRWIAKREAAGVNEANAMSGDSNP